MMPDVGVFLNSLLNYDKNHIPGKKRFHLLEICFPCIHHVSVMFSIIESSLKAVEEYLQKPDFNPDAIRRVSVAAAGLCAWAINIVQYYRVYCEVEPKRLAAEEATEQLRQTEEQFNATQAKLAVR